MANLERVLKVTQEQYDTLAAGGSVGDYTGLDPDILYLVVDNGGGGGGMSNPMTTADDIIIGGASGVPTRLAKGTQGQVLKVGSSSLEWANESGGLAELLIEKTRSELKTLRDNSQLIPGMKYRITDYSCVVKTTPNSYMTSFKLGSANHVFDIIVTALSTNKLSEEAKAIQHSGDTYFSNCKLNAWKIWYCIDNDTTRFNWITSSSKGVIYKMIDEFDNEAPYDFKNILLTKTGSYTAIYTFNYSDSHGTYQDASIDGINKTCHHNIIRSSRLCEDTGNNYQVPFIVFISTNTTYNFLGCYDNHIDGFTWNIQIGRNSMSNIIAGESSGVTLGINAYYNTIIDSYNISANYSNIVHNYFRNSYGISFNGTNCEGNTFINSSSISLKGDCSYNTFEATGTTGSIVLNQDCIYNTFTRGCTGISLGQGCQYISFGTNCQYIKLNYDASSLLDKGCVRNVIFERDIMYLNVYQASASNTHWLQNITFKAGIQGTDPNNLLLVTPPVDISVTAPMTYTNPNAQEEPITNIESNS